MCSDDWCCICEGPIRNCPAYEDPSKKAEALCVIAGLMRTVVEEGYAEMETTPRPPDFLTWSHHPMEGGARRITTRRSVYLDASQDRTPEE